MNTRSSVTIVVSLLLLTGCTNTEQPVTLSENEMNGSASAIRPSEASSDSVVTVTRGAAEVFKQYLQGSPQSYILLSVKGDATTGFMYDLKVQPLPANPDHRLDRTHGFVLAVSARDSLFLEGATISWETQADGSEGFKFDNPNAVDPNAG